MPAIGRLLRTGFRFLLLIALAATPVMAQTADGAVAFTHVNVIDTSGGRVLGDMTVVIRGQRIAAVGKARRVKLPGDAQVVEARGQYLIPGLWDMHVHTVFGDWLPQAEARSVALPLWLANGITGVRDMGSDMDVVKGWREQVAAGKLLGPRMVIAGPILDGPQPRFPASVPVATPKEGRRAVDDLKAKGVDFIKVQSLVPRDAYFAVADEARKQAITLVGHVPDAVRASETSNAGQKSIEHFTGIFEGCSTAEDQMINAAPKGPKRYLDTFSDARADALFHLLAKNRTWVVPTLLWERGQWLVDDIDLSQDPLTKYAPAVWKKTWAMFTGDIMKEMDTDPIADRRRFVQQELDITLAMHKTGVRFLAGTDTAAGVHIFPGFSLHQELQRFVAAGFTPLEALQTATLNPAEFLGMKRDLGTVEKGKMADLVLLEANPLQDVGNTQKIRAVVLAGRYLSRADLDNLLHQAEAAAGGAQ